MNSTTKDTCSPTETQVERPQVRTEVPTYRPNVDIVESAHDFTIIADVPGARPDAIDVTVEGKVLSLKAAITARSRPNSRAHISEYGVGNYERTFRLGEGVDVDNLAATLKDGVLTLRIPKAEPERRKIAVKTN